MAAKVAINGFGRIGRLGLRAMLERHKKDLNVVAVNDMADLNTNAHLFRYDSTYGIFSGDIEVGEGVLKLDSRSIVVLNQKDPSRLPWKQLGVDIVIESTGVFTDAGQVRGHLEAGAKKVIITAPATGEDITIVLGVNDADYSPRKHHIVSNASCTTNCLAPVAKVLHENFGVERGLMTTTHAYFGSDAQGFAPGPCRCYEYRPHDYGRREGDRIGHAGAQRKAPRSIAQSADVDRVGRGPGRGS